MIVAAVMLTLPGALWVNIVTEDKGNLEPVFTGVTFTTVPIKLQQNGDV